MDAYLAGQTNGITLLLLIAAGVLLIIAMRIK